MKRSTGVLTALSLSVASLFHLNGAIARAQNSDLPTLDTSVVLSSESLAGIEARQIYLDYGLLFLPAGAGGERQEESTWIGYLQRDLDPIAQSLSDQVSRPAIAAPVTPYTGSTPEELGQTQPDQRRLTYLSQ